MANLLVTDTNIFKDFDVGGLLDELFNLPETIIVPNTLYKTELDGPYTHLLTLGLETRVVAGVGVAQAYAWHHTNGKVSVNDCLALALAMQESCPLVSGDKLLRALARSEHVDIHGTLWLAEKLFNAGLLDHARLKTSYDLMKKGNRWLPWGEIERQLERLEDS